MSLPDTIKYKDTFVRTAPPGFDGAFDWSWTDGCFGLKANGETSKISPMDIDGVVEKKGHFIIFETKSLNTPIPPGQMIMLKAMYARGKATILFIQGKTEPVKAMAWCESGFYEGADDGHYMTEFQDVDRHVMHCFVKDWYKFANTTGANK